jgi:hypothetical protein
MVHHSFRRFGPAIDGRDYLIKALKLKQFSTVNCSAHVPWASVLMTTPLTTPLTPTGRRRYKSDMARLWFGRRARSNSSDGLQE